MDPVHIHPPKQPGAIGEKPLEPTFASLNARIFKPKCSECHSAGGKAKNTPLLTREDFVDSPDQIVVPGSPDDSALMIALEPCARKPMPPPDSRVAPLTREEIQIIEEWIRTGAPP